MDKEGVEQILGRAAAAGAEVAVKPHVQEEIDRRGHPLFWAEYKSVHFFRVVFNMFDVTHVFDVTPGSGAAGAAALALGAQYDGYCVNTAHKQWLDNLMDSAIFALAVESNEVALAVGATEEHVGHIKMFFSSTVKDAKRYLIAETPELEGAKEDGGSDDDESE